ncbi:MAG: hypothetical protein H6561_15105 [Lewinellaceae bacterium]|nr:hypothetical protein [Lewinellaceae bacterium]
MNISSIQIDRYSQIGEQSVRLEFLDSTNCFAGWNIYLSPANGRIQYNDVDFGQEHLQSIRVSGRSELVEHYPTTLTNEMDRNCPDYYSGWKRLGEYRGTGQNRNSRYSI